ncbi:hypothetical protein [Streptomyces sp. NPDC005486]
MTSSTTYAQARTAALNAASATVLRRRRGRQRPPPAANPGPSSR